MHPTDLIPVIIDGAPMILEIDMRRTRLDGSESSAARQAITNRIVRKLATAGKER